MHGNKSLEYYSNGISETFNGLGYLFVLMFLISQLQGIVDWTNIGVVISCKLIDFIN